MADEGTGDVDKGTGSGDPVDTSKDTQKTADTTADKGPAAVVKHAVFGELETDTADWLSKREDIKDVRSLAKIARDKDSMVGKQAEQLAKAIIPPGKDAKPEEIKAFNEKMGIGSIPEDYIAEFKVPKDLPENLPYDGERAKSFAQLAVEAKLTKAQAAAVHDWGIKNAVGDFEGSAQAETERQIGLAKEATKELEKLYGPQTGEQFKANAAFADRALTQLGGQSVIDGLKADKLIAEIDGVQVPQRAYLFDLFAKMGRSFFKEGEVVRGDVTALSNPFADGDQENITMQGRLIASDRPKALALIAAAGKKPTDFGLTA